MDVTSPLHILLHLHIFKNAGTSFDRSLRQLFGYKLIAYDTEHAGGKISIAQLAELQQANPNARAITSHQVSLPVPVYEGVIFHPVFFLRNPIERIQSCYHFEKDVQKLMTEDISMEQYVRRSLNNPSINACFGIQLATIADNRYFTHWNRSEITDVVINNALNNLQIARCFGVVDRFDESVQYIAHRMKQFFPEFNQAVQTKKHNVSSASQDIDDKVAYVKDSLSAQTYQSLLEELQPEILLYDKAKEVFNNRYNQLFK